MKEALENAWEVQEIRQNKCKELEEENRKLKENIAWYEKEEDRLREENKKLKSDLEQFSEAYKRYRDYEKEELAESCYDLARENEKLKEEIGKLVMKS